MISIVEKDGEKQRMLNICRNSPFGCKIAGIALAYGFDKRFSMFWIDDRQGTAYCLVDETMIVAGRIEDGEGAFTFIKLSGAKEITCTVENLKVMGFEADRSGEILQKQILGVAVADEIVVEAPVREIFALLEEVGMFQEEEDAFEAFYLDLSHRIRHGIARVVLSRREEQLVGCAVVSAVTGTTAILSAVAVQKEYRRHGIGLQLVQQAEGLLAGKTIYIYKETEKNNDFYSKLGFMRTELWAQKHL